MSDNILELRKATKLYSEVPAIDGVDFELRRGEIHADVGSTGCQLISSAVSIRYDPTVSRRRGHGCLNEIQAGVVGYAVRACHLLPRQKAGQCKDIEKRSANRDAVWLGFDFRLPDACQVDTFKPSALGRGFD